MASPTPERDFPQRQKTIEHFRAKTTRLKIHPAEKRAVWVIGFHLVFLSWAFGGMRPWAQWISLGWALIGLALALVPRDYTEEHTGANRFRLIMWPKLLRFPIFWLGAGLLALITIQGLNPSWAYATDGRGWWVQRIEDIAWLPTGVDVPFDRWGPWRMLVVYGSVWLTVCSIWVAFTRRRTIQLFAWIITANGLVLALIGMAQRFIPTRKLYWIWDAPPNAAIFASFIYKNHAGAFLFLSLVGASGLAAWYYYRGLRRMEKSNPSGVVAFIGTCIAVSIVVSYARGATLTTIAFLVIALLGFFIQQMFFAPEGTRRPMVLVVILVLFGIFVATGYEALRFGESWKRISRGLSGSDVSFNSRLVANRASAEMLGEHWQRGLGSGSWALLFPVYQQKYPEIWTFPSNKNRRQYWSHAHNDVLQIPIELGLTGMLLIAASWIYWFVLLLRRYFWQNPLSLLLVFGAMMFVGYSYFDFPFYCPAVLTLWCCLWPIAAIWAKLEESGGRA